MTGLTSDELFAARPPRDLLRAALWYSFRGWHVFPLSDENKRPITPNGFLDATTDAEQIRAWWTEHPNARIGVWLRRSGLLAIDVDVGDSKTGDVTFAQLEAKYGPLPRTCHQRSGRGGQHIIMRDPSPGPDGWTRPQHEGGACRGNLDHVGLGPHVDVKINGYVVLEPSGSYEWLALDTDDVQPVPDAWLEILRKPASELALGDLDLDEWRESVGTFDDGDAARLRKALADLGPREGGNNTTFHAIRLVFHAYGRGLDDGLPYLEQWNEQCGKPYEGHELERQVERVLAKLDVDTMRGASLGVHRWSAAQAAPGEPTDVIREVCEQLGLELPAPPAPPTLAEVQAHLLAAYNKLSRKTKSADILDAKMLRRVLKSYTLTDNVDDDPEAVLALCAAAVVRHAPPNAPNELLSKLFLRSVGAERALPAIERARTEPAAVASTAWVDRSVEPETDQEIAARLIPGREGETVKSCGSNIETILRYSSELRGRVRFNELTKAIEITDGRFARENPNGLDVAIKNWLETEWQLFAPTSAVGEQLLHVARTWGSYDPVREYLDGRAWDGVPRIDSWLTTYCHAQPSTYTSRVGAMFLISAVARALRPGSKVDTMLTLEGAQGARKSTALRVLGGDWFSDTPIVIGDKDGRMMVSCKWIIEFAELSSLKGRGADAVKAFLSSPRDDFRPPYGRATETFDRRCVFVGTTNDDEYLSDSTGDRRYWCVPVSAIDIDALERDRDQLWAEAVHRYRTGERWWFDDDEQLVADKVARDRHVDNPWVDKIRKWIERPAVRARDGFSLAEVAEGALRIEPADLKRHTRALGDAMRGAGFERRLAGSDRAARWFRPSMSAE